jgi:hypothetical protein
MRLSRGTEDLPAEELEPACEDWDHIDISPYMGAQAYRVEAVFPVGMSMVQMMVNGHGGVSKC